MGNLLSNRHQTQRHHRITTASALVSQVQDVELALVLLSKQAVAGAGSVADLQSDQFSHVRVSVAPTCVELERKPLMVAR